MGMDRKFLQNFVSFVLVIIAAAVFVAHQQTARHRAQADRASDALLHDIGATR